MTSVWSVLQVRGAPSAKDSSQLYPDDVGPTDDALCVAAGCSSW